MEGFIKGFGVLLKACTCQEQMWTELISQLKF